jgi:hypothetical protein
LSFHSFFIHTVKFVICTNFSFFIHTDEAKAPLLISELLIYSIHP